MLNTIVLSSRNGGSALIAEGLYALPGANQLLNEPYATALTQQRLSQVKRGFARHFETPFEIVGNSTIDAVSFLINNVYQENTNATFNAFKADGKLALLFDEINAAVPGIRWIFCKRDLSSILDRSAINGIAINNITDPSVFETQRAQVEQKVLDVLQTIEDIVNTRSQWVYVDGQNPFDENGDPILLTEFDPNNKTHLELAIVQM